MKAVTIHDLKSGKVWTEVVNADGPKWIDSARIALDLSIARGRLNHSHEPHLQLSVRIASQTEIAARIEEMKLARALRYS